MSAAVTVVSWTPRNITEGTLPRVAGDRVEAVAHAIHDSAVTRALEVAAETTEAWLADADSRVHGLLNTTHARNVAGRAHPTSIAILTGRLNRGRGVAETSAGAVWSAGAVGDMAANA